MRRLALAALAALLVLPGLAVATGGKPRPWYPSYGARDVPKLQVYKGVAMTDATPSALKVVLIKQRWGAPWGAVAEFKVGPETRFRGKAQAPADVTQGDRVQVSVVAPPSTRVADLPAVETVVDLGPAEDQTASRTRRGAEPEDDAGAPPPPPWLGRRVTFSVRGVVRVVGEDSLVVRVRRANWPARRALWRARTRLVTVEVAGWTRIRVPGEGRVDVSELEPGDRVLVHWRAPRFTPLGDLPPAKRVKVLF